MPLSTKPNRGQGNQGPDQTPRSFLRLVRSFRRDEDGGMIIFTLYMLLCMMLAVGLSLDTVRFEYSRTKLQNTLDRAVLAAADLEQVLPAKQVVEEYFDKAGLADHLISVDVKEGINYRTVAATSAANMQTIFVDMVGIDQMYVPAQGEANETLADIEIALVLDNSGSMGSNDNLRLDLLKPAAKDFIRAVARKEGDENTTAISIIPFATQVSAGETLLHYFNASDEHDYSSCVTFDSNDFKKASITPTETLERTAHFDASNRSWNVYDSNVVCSPKSNREITPWSMDADYLTGRIEAMTAGGWTSIELGTKWGAALLDPASRPILNAMVEAELVDEKLKNQPFEYDRPNAMKVLVVMSDGENTSQFDIKDPYREGLSPVFYDAASRDYTYYYPERSGSYDYWHEDRDQWYQYADGSDPKQMTWPEVWADMTAKRFAYDMKADAIGGSGSTYYNQIVTSFASSTKNTRTSQICQAAKDAGVTIFTIGMDTYGQGDTTLSECASAVSYFYDVRSLDISTAFAAIARQINQLRLTH